MSKWVEAVALPKNYSKVVIKLMKKYSHQIWHFKSYYISVGGKHFINQLVMRNLLAKYEFRHKVATTYHLHTSGWVKASNKEVKQILQNTVYAQRKDWAEKLDDALWAYKTPIETSLYLIVFGKVCYLPVELEHQAYWTIKKLNHYPKLSSKKRIGQLHELEEFRLHTHKNAKEKIERWHNKHVAPCTFDPGKQVLLF